MRRLHFAAIVLASMLGAFAGPAYPVGNVLVPTDDDNPRPDTSMPTMPSMPTLSSPPAESTPGVTPKMTLAPGLPPTGPASPPDFGEMPVPDASGKYVFQKPPTRVVKMPAVDLQVDPNDKNFTNSVNVTLQNYVWGPNDASAIYENIGLPAEQVQKSCYLSIMGSLVADKGGYIFTVGGSRTQSALRYSGKPSSLSMLATALCDAGVLPPNSGAIMQVGDKYSVFIAQFDCPLPQNDGKTLVLSYAGNGKGNCQYK